MKSRIIQLFGSYKVQSTSFIANGGKDIISVSICKSFFGLCEEITGTHQVFFDMYTHDGKYKINEGVANIDCNWTDIGFRNRSKIIKAIQGYSEYAFIVGNFRDTLKK